MVYLKYSQTYQGTKDLEWESRFTLGLNGAKNTHYINKSFKQKLFRIKFPRPKKKIQHTHISLSSQGGS